MDDAEQARLEAKRQRQKVWMLLMASALYKEKLFRDMLDAEGRRRRQRSLPRGALVDPRNSPWRRLYDSGIDQALITTTGFDHYGFKLLLDIFQPWFETHTPWVGRQDGSQWAPSDAARNKKNAGRKRVIDAKTCLGLVLTWCRFRGAEFVLQGWFGFVGSHCNVWLPFGRRGLVHLLWNNPLACIKMPDEARIELLKELSNKRHPVLHNIYCVADGLKLYFENDSEADEQSMCYNGWQHDHFITNLFTLAWMVASSMLLSTALVPCMTAP